jgi:hypothetical protein
MQRDALRRTVKRYQLEVPEDWKAPLDLRPNGVRRSSSGRDAQCTLVGEEREVIEIIEASGARIRAVDMLTLEDAALAFLPEDPA